MSWISKNISAIYFGAFSFTYENLGDALFALLQSILLITKCSILCSQDELQIIFLSKSINILGYKYYFHDNIKSTSEWIVYVDKANRVNWLKGYKKQDSSVENYCLLKN